MISVTRTASNQKLVFVYPNLCPVQYFRTTTNLLKIANDLKRSSVRWNPAFEHTRQQLYKQLSSVQHYRLMHFFRYLPTTNSKRIDKGKCEVEPGL
jgi:hypothetical protein